MAPNESVPRGTILFKLQKIYNRNLVISNLLQIILHFLRRIKEKLDLNPKKRHSAFNKTLNRKTKPVFDKNKVDFLKNNEKFGKNMKNNSNISNFDPNCIKI
jgi:hypothetical protein